MSIQGHKDYLYEKARLKYTKRYIEYIIKSITAAKEMSKENIKQAMIELDFLDSSQSYITILVNNELIKIGAQDYNGLVRSRHKPYFGRVDFREGNVGEPSRYYLGKVALAKRKESTPIIIDWRSPLANIYYDGRLGEVSYESPSGTVEGELFLKRQYTINDGQLEDFIDIDITTTDVFLQSSLQAHADNRLKDIASTIQSEQNKVIRAEASKPLIVQGVAGSGKTTIALHRIAYLMYTYEDRLIPENFLILAPNRLFINYISEVLPELGVERVRQLTFSDFVIELIGTTYRLINPNEKIQSLLEGEMGSAAGELLSHIAAYKGSLDFKNLIDHYVKDLEKQLVPQEDFMLEEHVLYRQEDVNNLLLVEYEFLPLYRRLELLKKGLANKLSNEKKTIVQELEDRYEKQIENARKAIVNEEERRVAVVYLMDERDEKLSRIKKTSKTLVAKYLSKIVKRNLLSYYQDVAAKPEVVKKYSTKPLDEGFITAFCQHSAEVLKKKSLEYEDLAALAYLEHLIFGAGEKPAIQHVVIDEAQDYSLFQFYMLRQVLNTKLFSILGDLSQGIHAYRAIDNWQQVIETVFDKDDCQFLTLEQSYRTTVEIMSLANEVIKSLDDKGLTLAKPVIRHGAKPQVLKAKKESDMIAMIKEIVEHEENRVYKSFAVVCKNRKECERIHLKLRKAGVEATLLTGEEGAYVAGVVILPSYITKGLEFDVVLIINSKDRYMANEMDTKLLYVAMTRSLHKLYVGYIDGTIPLLDKADGSLFEEYLCLK